LKNGYLNKGKKILQRTRQREKK